MRRSGCETSSKKQHSPWNKKIVVITTSQGRATLTLSETSKLSLLFGPNLVRMGMSMVMMPRKLFHRLQATMRHLALHMLKLDRRVINMKLIF